MRVTISLGADSMKIIRAMPEHAELVVPLFDAYRQFYKQKSDIASAREFLTERLKKDQSVIFLAIDEQGGAQKGIGFTQLYPSFSSSSMRRLWILNDLFVIPGARKQGVGEALMERARKWAVETKAEGLALETATDNHTAQRLYEKLGYKKDEIYYRYNLTVR
jgi:GNAT superfamily N-acetyltransferase